MERKLPVPRGARGATALAAVLLAFATVWDALRMVRLHVPPIVSYVLLGLAVAATIAGVLRRVLAHQFARKRNVVELLTAAIIVLAWWLRGDRAIPADPPIVAAELVATLVLAASATLRDRRRQRL
jgi:hypothetical protein